MKKLFCVAFIVLLFSGCVPMDQTPTEPSKPIEAGIPKLESENAASVGDTFFTFTSMGSYFQASSNWKFELTVVELNQEKMGLQYSEYMYSPGRTIGYSFIPGGWMIKEGFNKRFDYAVADGIIRFKGYEFEVLSVENGQIKYRRVK